MNVLNYYSFHFPNRNVDEHDESAEIGPNFNSKQFLAMIKRVSQSSWQKRCKKISGDDNAYDKALAAGQPFKTCIENWNGAEEIKKSYIHTNETGDYKSMFRA